MFSWSLATDSLPPGTRITLTDTKRRWQKHRFERCLPGLLVSNTSKWIKLSPIKYLTTLFSPLVFPSSLPSFFSGKKNQNILETRSAICKYYANVPGPLTWYVQSCSLFWQKNGLYRLGITSRTRHFCVQRVKVSFLLELKASPASMREWGSTIKKKRQLCSSPCLLSSKAIIAKLNIYFTRLNAFNDRIFLVLYLEFLIKLLFF